MKLILNKHYGIFSLSKWARKELQATMTEEEIDDLFYLTLESRSNPRLIEVVEKLGVKDAGTYYATLRIIEIPDDFTDYKFKENDGAEEILYVSEGKIHEA